MKISFYYYNMTFVVVLVWYKIDFALDVAALPVARSTLCLAVADDYRRLHRHETMITTTTTIIVELARALKGCQGEKLRLIYNVILQASAAGGCCLRLSRASERPIEH